MELLERAIEDDLAAGRTKVVESQWRFVVDEGFRTANVKSP
jgi:hypothetical protein